MVERRRRRSLSSGSKIGKYHLREPIRVQSDRSLFQAYDPFLDRVVAIKIIQLFDPASEGLQVANETFFAEARAIGRLQHQNIVSVYDAGMGDYEGYIVMEYVSGKSLEEILTQHQKLSLKDVLRITIQVCQALQYANSKQIVHRDIKPSNIMVSVDNQVKLVDFGISLIRSTEENMPSFIGTPSYIAPELIDDSKPSALSDLFSLGVLMYQMLSGELPFTGKDIHAVLYKIMYEQPEDLIQKVKNLPASSSDLVKKLLAKKPEQRFESAQQLKKSAEKLLLELDSKTPMTSSKNTQQLQALGIFQECSSKVMHELDLISEFKSYQADTKIINSEQLPDNIYYYVMEGELSINYGDKILAVTEKNWISANALQSSLGDWDCSTSCDTKLLCISGAKLQSVSTESQLYFYRLVMQQMYNYL